MLLDAGVVLSVVVKGTDGFVISTEPGKLDVDRIHHWLATGTVWGRGRSRDNVRKSIDESLNFGVYDSTGLQVGYARVVTDRATFAWLCDVYVAASHRGRGIGTWLATAVRDELEPYRLKRILLSTTDAHEVYAKAGFVALPDPGKMMILMPGDTRPAPHRAVPSTRPAKPLGDERPES